MGNREGLCRNGPGSSSVLLACKAIGHGVEAAGKEGEARLGVADPRHAEKTDCSPGPISVCQNKMISPGELLNYHDPIQIL